MLTFCNSYPTVIWTSISFWEPEECPEGDGWHNIGWYWVDPGTCRVVFQNDVDAENRYWYYYAEANDGAKWAGEFPMRVKQAAFDHCNSPADSQMFELGFRELDVGDADNYTLTFTGSG